MAGSAGALLSGVIVPFQVNAVSAPGSCFCSCTHTDCVSLPLEMPVTGSGVQFPRLSNLIMALLTILHWMME